MLCTFFCKLSIRPLTCYYFLIGLLSHGSTSCYKSRYFFKQKNEKMKKMKKNVQEFFARLAGMHHVCLDRKMKFSLSLYQQSWFSNFFCKYFFFCQRSDFFENFFARQVHWHLPSYQGQHLDLFGMLDLIYFDTEETSVAIFSFCFSIALWRAIVFTSMQNWIHRTTYLKTIENI